MNPFCTPNLAAAGNAATSGAGAAVTLSFAADVAANRSDLKALAHVVGGVSVSYSAAPTGGNLQIKDGTTVVFDQDILLGGPTVFNFFIPLKGTQGNKMDFVLAAPGGAIVGKIAVLSHWQEP